MRLLFNNNLSQRLKTDLADLYPGSLHVKDIGPENAPDSTIWDYAHSNDLVIVTIDQDYRALSRTRGHPPKVVLMDRRNRPRSVVAALLRSRYDELIEFYRNNRMALLSLD